VGRLKSTDFLRGRGHIQLLTALAVALQVMGCGLVDGRSELPVDGSSDLGGTAGSSQTGASGEPGASGSATNGGAAANGGAANDGGFAAQGGATGLAGTTGVDGGGHNAGSGGTTGGAGGGDQATAGGGAGGASQDPKKVVLFDGSVKSFDTWAPRSNPHGYNPWTNNGDGTMTVKGGTGDILSKQTFGNVFVHLEYMVPKIPVSGADGREMGNSGVLLNGSYELQILARGPFDVDKMFICGAVYGVRGPLSLACYQEEAWNTYEIEFEAPTCEDPMKVTRPARFVEVKLNGTVIHRNVDVPTPTLSGLIETCQPRGLLLQDGASLVPVSFRNIWAVARD
jgi:hypothetical protein